MNEFMVLVERAVRPVRAEPRRKMRMRQELLAHLTASYEEELARRGDEAAAREAAAQRFGDPAAIARELQATVPAWERLLHAPVPGLGWLDRGRRDEILPRFGFAAGVAVVAALLYAPCVFVAGDPSDIAARAGIDAAFGGLTGAVVLLVLGMCRAASRWRAVAFAAAALAVQAPATLLSLYLVTGDFARGVERLPLPLGVLAAFLVGLAACLRFAARRPAAEWRRLELE
jgi:hypothetical protein